MYRILKYPWHTGHDYELSKLPHRFLYLSGTYREWALEQRPVPSSIEWVSSLWEKKSDLMILHLDQWSLQEPSKRFLYQYCRERYSGPKVVILHGARTEDGCSPEEMAELTEGCKVVCNSSRALEDWNLKDSRFILHGFSSEEWKQTDYSRLNIVVCLPHRPRHLKTRNQSLIDKVEQVLPLTWIGRDISFGSFDAYRRYLSESSVYFNPSFGSANPRSRAEAMLCGLAVVTTASHGEEEYIRNGENGFCSNNPDELQEYLLYLRDNPLEIERVGRNGRETARQLFSIDRFAQEWESLLEETLT